MYGCGEYQIGGKQVSAFIECTPSTRDIYDLPRTRFVTNNSNKHTQWYRVDGLLSVKHFLSVFFYNSVVC